MDSKKRKIYIIIVFIAVCIWGYYNIFNDDNKKKAEIPEPTKTIQTVIASSASTEKPGMDFGKYSGLSWGKDPFFRSIKKIADNQTPKEERMLWILGGILYNENNPAAVINKSIVRHGDIIDGARVVNISRKNVTLEKEGTRFELKMSKEKS